MFPNDKDNNAPQRSKESGSQCRTLLLAKLTAVSRKVTDCYENPRCKKRVGSSLH
eukprot:COSAG02_NODE_5158_length_4582_cov_15.877091_4_plen_55_part_00